MAFWNFNFAEKKIEFCDNMVKKNIFVNWLPILKSQ